MKNRILVVLTALWLLCPTSYAGVTFAHISDTHITTQGSNGSWLMLKDSTALLSDMLEQVKDKAQFVLITGNVVHTPDQWEAFLALASQYPVPIYVCLGNRDAMNGQKLAVIQRLNQANANSFNLIDKFNPLSPSDILTPTNKGYYRFSPVAGVNLLVLDTTGTTAGVSNGKGQLDDTQQLWLKQQLDYDASQPIPPVEIVAMHHPLLEPYASPSRQLPAVTRIQTLKMLEQSPLVSMVLSGAYHAAKVQHRQGILHISTPAMVEYPAAARLITLQDDGQAELQWIPTRLQKTLQISRSRSPWVKVANGNGTTDHQWTGRLRYYPTAAMVTTVKQRLKKLEAPLINDKSMTNQKGIKPLKPTTMGVKKPASTAKDAVKGSVSNFLPTPAPRL